MKEKELLERADAWFSQKYGGSPQECEVNFSKVWNKQVLFLKFPTVVFAPSEVEGMAFIKAQRSVLRMMTCFFLYAGAAVTLFFLGAVYNFMVLAMVFITVVGIILIVCNILCAMSFKRLENLYENKIELYVSGMSET